MWIQVEAPCDMNEGYTFLARTTLSSEEGEEFFVTVPKGGVRQGEIFCVVRSTGTRILSFTNLPDAAAVVAATSSETTPLMSGGGGAGGGRGRQQQQHQQWKASLCDSCCRQGVGRAGCAVCCPQLVAAQVMVRLRLNWLGVPDYAASSHNKRTLAIVTTMVCVFWVLLVTMTIVPHLLLEDDDDNDFGEEEEQGKKHSATIIRLVSQVICILFGVYTLYILTKLRHFVRRKYQIANPRSNACCATNDCCVSLWCSCCVASQLLRQTAEDGATTDCRCCSPYNNDSMEDDANSTATESSSRCDDGASLTVAEVA